MSDEKPHILVVDDDNRLRDLLKKYLSDQGFVVTVATDAADARRKLVLFVFDLIVLDIMMPGETGLELAGSLTPNLTTPILLLTAMGETQDRISGLEAGVDDYLTKPFEPRELVLRIRTILRRVSDRKEKQRKVNFGEFSLDLSAGKLTQNNEPVYLTSMELVLLKALAEQAGQPVSREELARLSEDAAANERTVDVQINRLRKKIEPAPGKPVYIQTIRSAGYVLNPD